MANKPKYDWTQFTLKVFIKATPAKVFQAWTDDKMVSKWFTEKTIIEPKKGGRIYLEWITCDKMDAKVISIIKNRKFVFPFGSKGEEVEVKFKKKGKGAICELHQYNMKTSPDSRWNMHMGCRAGWTFFLANLKAYLEHGIDLRGHDPKMSYREDFIDS